MCNDSRKNRVIRIPYCGFNLRKKTTTRLSLVNSRIAGQLHCEIGLMMKLHYVRWETLISFVNLVNSNLASNSRMGRCFQYLLNVWENSNSTEKMTNGNDVTHNTKHTNLINKTKFTPYSVPPAHMSASVNPLQAAVSYCQEVPYWPYWQYFTFIVLSTVYRWFLFLRTILAASEDVSTMKFIFASYFLQPVSLENSRNLLIRFWRFIFYSATILYYFFATYLVE